MLSFGNKDFRNLQEQVLKNMSDIQDMMQGVNVLADFGIKVVGQVDSAADLPDPSEYEGDYGDAYVVGESEPYDYYIFTRAFEGEEEPQWFDLGQFPVPGPQGETGPQGEIGETPNVAMEIGTVSTLISTQSATASIVKSGTLENPVFTLNLAIPKGPMGMMGLTGPQGPRGPQGPQGEKGDKGEQGGLIEIVGIVETASQLPSPATLQKLDAAYLVGASPDYELYVQVGESPSTALWTNLGAINEGTVVTVNGEPQTVWEASGQFVAIYDGQLVDTLYGQAAGTGNGQTHVPYGTSATANYIVQRDINAQIEVPQTPTNNGHAASKKYVDDTVAAVLPTAYAGDLIVGTSTAHQATRLAIGSANQLLGVNSAGTGLEYKTINSVPAYTSSDNDKVLKVNSLGTALEWGTVSSGGGSSVVKDLSTIITNGTASNSGILSSTSSLTIGSSSTIADSLIVGGYIGGSYINRLNMQKSLVLGELTYRDNYRSRDFTSCIILKFSTNYRPKFTSATTSIFNYTDAGGGGDYDNAGYISNCILWGSNLSIRNGGSYWFTNKWLLGDYLYLDYAYNGGSATIMQKSQFILGQYNEYKTGADVNNSSIIIGAGTSDTARANCFQAGNDGTNDYIYIGDTKLTETQLQALLATL